MKDLVSKSPAIQFWDYEHNKDIDISNLTVGSGIYANWKCEKGHMWNARVQTVCNSKYPCPYCNGRKPIVGINDFATVSPDIAKEWDYDKNAPNLPEQFLNSSSKRFYWICKNNHSYDATIQSRTRDGYSCPFCSKTYATEGEHLSEDLKKDWGTSNRISCNHINRNSDFYAFWTCHTCGLKWRANVIDRTKGSPCPKCARKDYPKLTDLCQHYKLILKDSSQANETYELEDEKEWICEQNPEHTYTSSIYLQLIGRKCPYCNSYDTVSKENSLLVKYPKIAQEWDFEKNTKRPSEVKYDSKEKVYWICSKGHKYNTSIYYRTIRNTGCPYCSGRYAIPDETSLSTCNPALVREWDYDKNTPISPNRVKPNSSRKVWWKCPKCGHNWKASIHSRNRGFCKCPKCNRKAGE